MSNDLHWDAKTQRMRPGLALYKSDIEDKISFGERWLDRITAEGASEDARAAVREQIANWKALRESLDSVSV